MATTDLPEISGPVLTMMNRLAWLTLGIGMDSLALHTRVSVIRRGTRLIASVENWQWAFSVCISVGRQNASAMPRVPGPFRQVVMVPGLDLLTIRCSFAWTWLKVLLYEVGCRVLLLWITGACSWVGLRRRLLTVIFPGYMKFWSNMLLVLLCILTIRLLLIASRRLYAVLYSG